MRRVLKGLVWLVAIAASAVALLFGINATDESPSPQTLAALNVPPPPAPSERNGYLDLLALGAPADAPTFATGVEQLRAVRAQEQDKWISLRIDPGVRRCKHGTFLTCVTEKQQPSVGELLAAHAVLLARYRAMREKPEFVELLQHESPEDPLPAFQGITSGHRLSLLHASLEFNAGRRAAAVSELEAEFAFHRKVVAGGRMLITKMIAVAMLDGTAFFAAELARKLPAQERALWRRLEAALRPMTKAELDLAAVMANERAIIARSMQTRRYVRMSDAVYEMFKSFGEPKQRPWWDAVAPYLYRPNYSVNRYVGQSLSIQEIASRPSHEFYAARAEARARADALLPPIWLRWIVSPVGYDHEYLRWDDSDYIARMHVRAGFQSLVALQVHLRSAGMRRPADIEKALAGPLGS